VYDRYKVISLNQFYRAFMVCQKSIILYKIIQRNKESEILKKYINIIIITLYRKHYMLSKLRDPIGPDSENDTDLSNKVLEDYDISTNILTNESQYKNKNKEVKEIKIPTFIEYLENPQILSKYKIPELKAVAKFYKLLVGGTKPILITRIQRHFQSISKTIIIQRIYRGYLVRESVKLRGEAFKNRSLCVNTTDFYTMEPITEIDSRLFFSYSDNSKFHYGFDIDSLFSLISKTNRIKILNPYNREKIDNGLLDKINSLGNKIQILYPGVLQNFTNNNNNNNNQNRNYFHNQNQNRNINTTPNIAVQYNNNSIFNRITTPELRILEINRQQPIQTRIQELFMEIDQLGNYTNPIWFSSLTRQEYIRLYRLLYSIWSRLSYDTRNKICITGNPFLNIFRDRIVVENILFDTIQEACLRVFENMVFSGIDIEFRKIGALHVLSALTVISNPARLAIPWLYESVV